MGIPHLIATLDRYAQAEALQDVDVVIDGPALAHHILHVCRANGIRQPSNHLLGRAVIAWLDELENQRVTVQRIYFDGHLPSSKRTVRMQRMMRSISSLDELFSANPRGMPVLDLGIDEGGENGLLGFDVFAPGNVSVKPSVQLHPCFLVPAVMDGLRRSTRYRTLLTVVPGEADSYCANHVAQQGGTVLTSDSDLLAHDLGRYGRVVFLRDVYRSAHDGGLSCSNLHPWGIYREKLALPASVEAHRLAYERRRSPNVTLQRLVKACSLPVVDVVDYDEFRQQYIHPETAPLPTLKGGEVTLPLDGLDPRLSELLLQLGQTGVRDASIFLPVVVESPSKGTAWEPSMPVRRLAYTIAGWALHCPPSTSVQEYRRVKSRDQKGRQVGLMPWDNIATALDALASLIRRVTARRQGKEFRWTLACLALNVLECQEQGKHCHVWEIIRQVATHPPPSYRDLSGKVSWDLVHFIALLQAGYYSLRLLSQVLSLIPDSADEELSRHLSTARNVLSEFPSIDGFPNVPHMIRFLCSAREMPVLDILQDAVPLTSESSTELEEENETSVKLSTSPARYAKGNMFGPLVVDE